MVDSAGGEPERRPVLTPPVRSGELFAALSLATDLGTGQPAEHGLRTCLLALELAGLIGVEGDELEDVYYLGLLHSIGCTADAPESAGLFGDDIAPKAAYTLIDPARSVELLSYLWRNVYPHAPSARRLRAFGAALRAGPERPRANLLSHCEVGERLGQRVRLPPRVSEALWFVFERWDGKGLPNGIAGEQIPVAARLLHVARAAAAFDAAGGPAMVAAMAEHAGGSSLEPELAELLRDHAGALLERVAAADAFEQVVASEPGARVFLGGELDEACRVLGDYADLKSYGTLGHSRATAGIADAAGWRLGLDAAQIAELRRAAWLHDLGRVGVSAAIWEKPGPLTGGEWEQVRMHSYHTERLTARIPALGKLVHLAACDHERLDGSGCHRGLSAAQLPLAARVLAVADAWCAMIEPRPYRPPLTTAAAAGELRAQARAGGLAGDAVDALLAAAGESAAPVAVLPAGLTAREVEVLLLLARGLTKSRRRHVSESHRRRSAATSSRSTPRSAPRPERLQRCSRSSMTCCMAERDLVRVPRMGRSPHARPLIRVYRRRITQATEEQMATMTADTDLAFAGVARLGELLAQRDLTPRELTEFYLRRIESLDPRLGASSRSAPSGPWQRPIRRWIGCGPESAGPYSGSRSRSRTTSIWPVRSHRTAAAPSAARRPKTVRWSAACARRARSSWARPPCASSRRGGTSPPQTPLVSPATRGSLSAARQTARRGSSP
jgi:HD-GYP domain-containing protein (c-di-GMP phosphodiesterase class II)